MKIKVKQKQEQNKQNSTTLHNKKWKSKIVSKQNKTFHHHLRNSFDN